MSETLTTRLSYSALGTGILDASGDITFAPTPAEKDNDKEMEQTLAPEATGELNCIYLPLETLLVRKFQLPLQHTRHLDAAMLAQELADAAGIEPNDWWLTWHADKTERGITGLVFGLPKAEKKRIQETPSWQQTPLLLIDGWERLNDWLHTAQGQTAVAIIDADAEGVFFGFYQNGIWQGMRRLNADTTDTETSTNLSNQIIWSLRSMGFEPTSMPVLGRIPTTLEKSLKDSISLTSLNIEDTLPERHTANLRLPIPNDKEKTSLNLRHGKWAVKKRDSLPKSWQRPVFLAAAVCFLWLTVTSAGNFQLENQLVDMNDDITASFHQGLPNQPVIIDALAQLRQAANQGGVTNQSALVSTQLNGISSVFKTQPWDMQELKIDMKGSSISGKVSSLDTLNNIRKLLEEKIGQKVQIADTDLNGDEVSFRITWS
ncbi:MAG: hypothetical protein R8M46_09850 [Ghiorsea sp.]